MRRRTRTGPTEAFARSVAAVTVITAGIVFVGGWLLDIAVLRSVLPGLATMKPNTALALLTLGAALWLSVPAGAGARLVCFRVLAFLGTFIGAATLAEYVFGWNPGIDVLLPGLSSGDASDPFPGRPSANTALGITLLGVALLVLAPDGGARRGWSESLALTVTLVALVGLLGYAFAAGSLYDVALYSSMAVHTASLLFLLSLGIVSARRHHRLTAILLDASAGGYMARRLLPAALVIPPLLAALGLLGDRLGYYGPEFRLALAATSSVVVFGALIVWNAAALREIDTRRQEAERNLQRTNSGLEATVAERTRELRTEVAERRHAERELQDYAARLAAANLELESFSYSVSHDLRAPLRAIDGFSRILLDEHAEALDESGRGYLQRVRRAAQRMAQLIDDLLKLSRVTRDELERADVDLSGLASEVARVLARDDPQRRVDFTVAPGLRAHADPHLVRVALENLIGNAWKFTAGQPTARVEFGLQTRNGHPAYFVRDNGVGFDMTYADKLFGAFQRLHDVQDFPGTGIGLATVRRIVAKHGGCIEGEGVEGAGATFYFTLGEDDAHE